MSTRRLSELEKNERRRAWFRTAAAVALTCFALVGTYYLAPANRISEAGALARLGVGIALFSAVLVWQVYRITRAELPELRAVAALGVIIPLFLAMFAITYLSMSHASAAAFSQHLDHTSALYFTITVFSTVGFGDITPGTDLARIVVSIQMLLDLVIIAAVVRVLVTAAKTGLARTGTESSDQF